MAVILIIGIVILPLAAVAIGTYLVYRMHIRKNRNTESTTSRNKDQDIELGNLAPENSRNQTIEESMKERGVTLLPLGSSTTARELNKLCPMSPLDQSRNESSWQTIYGAENASPTRSAELKDTSVSRVEKYSYAWSPEHDTGFRPYPAWEEGSSSKQKGMFMEDMGVMVDFEDVDLDGQAAVN